MIHNKNEEFKFRYKNVQYIKCTICGEIKWNYKALANHLTE